MKSSTVFLVISMLVISGLVYFLMVSSSNLPPATDVPSKDSGVVMNFVSGTEYKPNQAGQVIVEARYILNGTSAISTEICVQGAFNTSSICGGVASNTATDYFENQTTSFGQIAVVFNDSQDNQNRHTDAIFNYTKPFGARNDSVLTAGLSNGTDVEVMNFTIPSSCWNAYPTKLKFGVRLGNTRTVSPFYIQFVQLFCYNGSGYQSMYFAGNSVGSGSDNPNGVVSDLHNSFDSNFSTLTCSAQAFGELQYSPSPPYFGNQACRRGGSQQFTSGSSVAEFSMNWNISNCEASVWYPDKSSFISNKIMDLSDSNGNAFINFTVPNIDGVYEYQSHCHIQNKTLVASHSFHVTKQRIRAVIPK